MKPLSIMKPSAIAKCDASNGTLDSMNCLPSDAVVSYVCLRELDSCANTDPPSIQMNMQVCLDKFGLTNSCSDPNYLRKVCCAKSETIDLEADNFCTDKDDYTKCKPNPVLSEEYGRCLNEKCISEQICCTCYANCILNNCLNASCKNNLNVKDCSDWCKNKNYIGFFTSYSTEPSNYTCESGIFSECKHK